MTRYCQHAPRLRLVGADGAETLSERPRHPKTDAFTDVPAGTQIEIPPDLRGFDLAFALRTGSVAELPCPAHPGEPAPANVPRGTAPRKGDDGG